jgi:hypothetical protein
VHTLERGFGLINQSIYKHLLPRKTNSHSLTGDVEMEAEQVFSEDRLICRGCGGYIDSNHPDVKYNDEKKTQPVCIDCGLPLVKMCPEDHQCHCAMTIHAGTTYCPTCKKPTCVCGSHDVAVWTRVTGYLQSLEGFNAAKKQEVKDRHRVDINNGVST